ncbi:hypothetical protein GCM10023152_35320 [Agromyces bauzanensis]|nr:HepT-like ribonuclease domain-containing protein [Agromyces bauzanensis]
MIEDYATRTDDDGIVFDAIRIRLVEIGEAVKDLDPSATAPEPDIPWEEIAQMRDQLAHRYFDTSHAIVMATARNDIPLLKSAVGRLLDGERSQQAPFDERATSGSCGSVNAALRSNDCDATSSETAPRAVGDARHRRSPVRRDRRDRRDRDVLRHVERDRVPLSAQAEAPPEGPRRVHDRRRGVARHPGRRRSRPA